MRSSSRLTSTACSSSAVTVSLAVSSRGYRNTQLTTLRSGLPCAYVMTSLTLLDRCLIACIKHLAGFPCPACLMPKDDIDKMGTVNDMKNRTRLHRTLAHNRYVSEIVKSARKKIFEQGAAPEGATVDDALKLTSITSSRVRHVSPGTCGTCGEFLMSWTERICRQACRVWAERLRPPRARPHARVRTRRLEGRLHAPCPGSDRSRRRSCAGNGQAVRSISSPSCRVLDANPANSFSLMPTFGRDTIRRFGANMSAMKKLAARDFEDILQVRG